MFGSKVEWSGGVLKFSPIRHFWQASNNSQELALEPLSSAVNTLISLLKHVHSSSTPFELANLKKILPPSKRIPSHLHWNQRKRRLIALPSSIMSVELDPAELGFKRKQQRMDTLNRNTLDWQQFAGPFSHEVSEVLRLKNPNSEPLAFKVSLISMIVWSSSNSWSQVKTTAPKQ